MNRGNKKKDLKLVLFCIITAVAGFVHLIFNGNLQLIPAYILLVIFSIPTAYFAYSLGKWENRWENRWKERNPGDGEPSELLLVWSKIASWVGFAFAMILALIPKF